MRTPRRLSVVLSALALSGALVACGDDDVVAPEPGGTVETPGEVPVPGPSPDGTTDTDEEPTEEPGTTGDGATEAPPAGGATEAPPAGGATDPTPLPS